MYNAGWAGMVHKVSSYITKAAYLNALWIFFSILGLIVLGIFPATIALFAVLRKMITHPDLKIFPFFWKIYKSELLKGNIISYLVVLPGVILGVDLWFVSSQNHVLFNVLFGVLCVIMLLYLLLLVNFFPVYVHYDLKLFAYIKQSLFVGILRPMVSFVMLFSITVLWVLFYLYPAVTIFFGASVSAYIIMFMSHSNFTAIERKTETE